MHHRNVDKEYKDNLIVDDEKLLRQSFCFSQIKEIEQRFYLKLKLLKGSAYYIPLDMIIDRHKSRSNLIIPVYRTSKGICCSIEEKAYK